MSNMDIVRAWKDEDYRLSLSDAEQAILPENPAGMVELAEDEAIDVNGASYDHHCNTVWGSCICTR